MTKDRHSLYSFLLKLLVIWYLGACLVHYISHRSLWNDELAVFQSIRFFKPTEFFNRTLLVDQAFPHFYLFLVQALAKPFGYSIAALRFLPLMCMVAAFFVWMRIARRELVPGPQLLTYLLCWTASVPLIYYSAELKQYSMDVLLSGAYVSFLLSQEKLNKSPGVLYLCLLAILPAGIFFSYPAYFFLMLPLWNLFIDFRKDGSRLKYLIIYAASVLICVALSFMFDVRLRPTTSVTLGFNDYFISTHSLNEFFQTFGEGINNLFSRWFVELPKVFRKLARVFMLFGLVFMFIGSFKDIRARSGRLTSVGVIAGVVIFELAIAAAFQKYPFGVPRTALFLCPMLLILTVQGIAAVKSFNRYVYNALHTAFVVYLLAVAAGVLGYILTKPFVAIPEIWTL